jgi:hypothetical protein
MSGIVWPILVFGEKEYASIVVLIILCDILFRKALMRG